ncbi:hypothetical protein GGS26DRAFT_553984 [Hypomontagnella submonticulosa]|nr:hypothetical protein GGS26DRAFT_553984 [Hypomontagnella submonticulosa]
MAAFKLTHLMGLIGALVPAFAIPTVYSRQTALPLPYKVIAQMNQTDDFVENIAVRSNGDLLVTLFYPTASVYTVKRPFSDSPTLSLVHTFEDANGLTGISETGPDTFVVAAALYQELAVPSPNTTSLWELKLGGGDQAIAARRIIHAPQASLLNGLVSIPSTKSAILVVDGLLGVLVRVDLTTGLYEVVLDVPELKPVAGKPLFLGANGLKIRDEHVYWSNTDLVSIYRIRVDEQGYPIEAAEVEKVVTLENSSGVDDFAFDGLGNIWVATNTNNTVVTVSTDGRQAVTVGSLTELTVAGDTAMHFGRTLADKHTLYVTTSGAAAAPVNGTIVEPGKIVAVDTGGYY